MKTHYVCWATKHVLVQNRFCIKTGFASYISRLQNWICPKTGQCKTCIISNTKIEASIRATKPKPWQWHLTSETVEIFIQNEMAGLVSMQSRFWCGRFRVGTKPVLVQQVERRHKMTIQNLVAFTKACLASTQNLLTLNLLHQNRLCPDFKHEIPKLRCFSSRLAAVFAQSNEVRCYVENEDVVGAAPTGIVTTTSERSTLLLPT